MCFGNRPKGISLYIWQAICIPMNMRSIALLLSLSLLRPVGAQELDHTDRTYLDDIATVLLVKNMDIYDPVPLIELSSRQQLKLSFDQLRSTNSYFNYTLVHCDAHWQPSDMQPSEYLEGNPMGEITNFSFSTNTYQRYVHYELLFPTAQMKPIRSGNYLLKVFSDFDEGQLVLTRRFMVIDRQVKATADVRAATDPEFRFSHQEVDVEVDYTGFDIPNPFKDVNLTIMQNNSWTTAITGIKPLFVNNGTLSFNYEDVNLFQGGHEFRSFDIRSLRFFSNQVIEKFVDSMQNVVLRPDESRSHLTYASWIDYNGKRVIDNKDGVDLIMDGDYAMVHFYLRLGDKSHLGDIYLYGELSDWQLKDAYRMHYDPALGMYYAQVKLKQSYYDYLYVLQMEDGSLEFSFTEGNHQETENDYTVLVYHRNVFYGYDELIGSVQKNSGASRD